MGIASGNLDLVAAQHPHLAGAILCDPRVLQAIHCHDWRSPTRACTLGADLSSAISARATVQNAQCLDSPVVDQRRLDP